MTFLWLRLLGDTELLRPAGIQQGSRKPSPHTHVLKKGLRRECRPRGASDPTARCRTLDNCVDGG